MSVRIKAEALLVGAAFVWGATFVMVKEVLQDISPWMFLLLRFTLAGVLLGALFVRGRIPRLALYAGLRLGLFLFGGYAFQTFGLVFTTPSRSAFITGFGVILVPLIVVLFGRRVPLASIFGAGFGLVGLYLLIVSSQVSGVNRGDLLTLAGSVCFALHIVFVDRYTRRFSFAYLVPVQILGVGLLAALALPMDPNFVFRPSGRLFLAVMITVVFSTVFAFSAQNWAQQYTPPSHTALIFTLEPVFAALTSFLVLGERLTGKGWAGSMLILGGMVLSELRGGQGPHPMEG